MRFIVKALLTIGLVSAKPIDFMLKTIASDEESKYDSMLNLLWQVPLVAITLPMFPAYVVGSSIENVYLRKEFEEQVKSLIHVHNPKDYAYIEKYNGFFYVCPFYYMNGADKESEFETEEDAKLFLQSMGYVEAIDDNKSSSYYKYSNKTIWVKQ